MGIFSRKRKENRVYSLGEAMKLLQTKEYENYTTIPVGDGYRLVPMQQPIVYNEAEGVSTTQERRNDFLNRLTDQVNQNKFNNVPKYNDYQSVKGYKQSQGIGR